MISGLEKFLSHFPAFDDEKNLFSYMDEYLKTAKGAKPVLFISIHKKFSEVTLPHCRFVINKKEKKNHYSDDVLKNVLSSLPVKNDLLIEKKIGDDYFYFFFLGHKKNQVYFALMTTKEAVDLNELKIMGNFTQGHLKIINRFEDLHNTNELIHIDDVTGLYNQRKLYKDLTFLVDKFQKEKDPFCILFIDIDYFKKVNDTYGHLVGTKLLESVARDVRGLLRDTDISYRYGGDEFVVILTNSDAAAGKIVGERILKIIKERSYDIDFKGEMISVRLSVSIGVAEFPTDAVNSQEILAIADRMMYEAKESGRGLVFNTQDVFKSSLKKAMNSNQLNPQKKE